MYPKMNGTHNQEDKLRSRSRTGLADTGHNEEEADSGQDARTSLLQGDRELDEEISQALQYWINVAVVACLAVSVCWTVLWLPAFWELLSSFLSSA